MRTPLLCRLVGHRWRGVGADINLEASTIVLTTGRTLTPPQAVAIERAWRQGTTRRAEGQTLHVCSRCPATLWARL